MAGKYRAFLLALLFTLGADQASKVWARHTLKPKFPEPMVVIHNYFELRYSENTGSAFGLLRGVPGSRYLFYVVGFVAFAVVGGYLRKASPGARRLGAELGLLAGGAAGNLIDRLLYGRVTDFIVWKVGAHEWPTFNVADAALVVGILGLLIDIKPEGAKEARSA